MSREGGSGVGRGREKGGGGGQRGGQGKDEQETGQMRQGKIHRLRKKGGVRRLFLGCILWVNQALGEDM